jgi:diguanylate cyclase (GGDEF)-like protein
LHAPVSSIALWNEDTGQLEIKAQLGIPAEAIKMPYRKDGLGMGVLTSGEPRYVENMTQLPNASAATQLIHTRSMACLPIWRGDKKLGLLYVNYTEPHAFTNVEKNLLQILATQTAIALENAQLYSREQRRAAELDIIAELGKRVTPILSLDELLPRLVKMIHSEFGYRYVHLFVNDPSTRQTMMRASQVPDASAHAAYPVVVNYHEGIIGWVAENGETLLANDVNQEPRFRFYPDTHDTQSELAVPIKIGKEILAVLDVQSEKLDTFDKSTVGIFETLATQIAIAFENARLYSQIQDQARRDSLTQVFNHGYLIEQLTAQAELALQNNSSLALIMLDIDHYKEYNDRYGHVVGDRVLYEIAQAIRANIKSSDCVGRWGGEEFAVVLPWADSAHAHRVASRISETLKATKLEMPNGTVIAMPTISQGIATIPVHSRNAAELIDCADAALYRAKERGRDQIQIAVPCS